MNRLPVDEMSDLVGAAGSHRAGHRATIGPRCEVVLHDYREWDRSGSTIVWIENGHVTGRHVGGPTTNLGLEAMRSGDASPDRFNYRTRTRKDGRTLRSTSIYFRNRAGEFIGALCINLDVSAYGTRGPRSTRSSAWRWRPGTRARSPRHSATTSARSSTR